MKYLFSTLLLATIQLFPQPDTQDSGGPLTPEWAAYDVKFYNINLNIDPDKQTIKGWVGVTAEAENNMKELVLDLDDRYRITQIVWDSSEDYAELNFKHENGKIKIELPNEVTKESTFTVKVYYGGKPRVAERPPWDNGFTCCQDPDLENIFSNLYERIDYVFTLNGNFRTISGRVIGDRWYNKTDTDPPLWPSDHGGLIFTLYSY